MCREIDGAGRRIREERNDDTDERTNIPVRRMRRTNKRTWQRELERYSGRGIPGNYMTKECCFRFLMSFKTLLYKTLSFFSKEMQRLRYTVRLQLVFWRLCPEVSDEIAASVFRVKEWVQFGECPCMSKERRMGH